MDLDTILDDLSKNSSSTAQDFDFLLGTWKVDNKIWRKTDNNKDSDEVEIIEFEADLIVRRIVGEFGQIDRYITKRIEASTLRLFDPKTKLWSLYWIDKRNPVISDCQVGTFTNSSCDNFWYRNNSKKKKISGFRT